jgi:hypothetical protein
MRRASYQKLIEKLDALIEMKGQYKRDDIGKMAIISAVLKMSFLW